MNIASGRYAGPRLEQVDELARRRPVAEAELGAFFPHGFGAIVLALARPAAKISGCSGTRARLLYSTSAVDGHVTSLSPRAERDGTEGEQGEITCPSTTKPNTSNRARVPEHPEIFARWTREAEDYRAEAMKERRAELGLSYGSSPRQFIDLFSPRPDVTSPVAVFIHGG